MNPDYPCPVCQKCHDGMRGLDDCLSHSLSSWSKESKSRAFTNQKRRETQDAIRRETQDMMRRQARERVAVQKVCAECELEALHDPDDYICFVCRDTADPAA